MSTKQNTTKPKPVKKEESGSNTFVNLILIAAIAAVFFGSSHIKESLQRVNKGVETLSAPLSAEPLKLDTPGNNPLCPGAVEDYDDCLDKLDRCKDTEK